MAIEIERKFLVKRVPAITSEPVQILQGYICDGPVTVRIRVIKGKAFITLKGETKPESPTSRQEFEYDIPEDDGKELFKLCKSSISKVRQTIAEGDHTWEIDTFSGLNTGLVVAEVELRSLGEPVVIPDWVGEEVTNDPRYFNSNLATKPYSTW